jgi:hypothetical protein
LNWRLRGGSRGFQTWPRLGKAAATTGSDAFCFPFAQIRIVRRLPPALPLECRPSQCR